MSETDVAVIVKLAVSAVESAVGIVVAVGPGPAVAASLDSDCTWHQATDMGYKPEDDSADMSMVPAQLADYSLEWEAGTFHLVVMAWSSRKTSYGVSTAAKRTTVSLNDQPLLTPLDPLICILNAPFLTFWRSPTLLLYQWIRAVDTVSS
jgi:hypothetical protein